MIGKAIIRIKRVLKTGYCQACIVGMFIVMPHGVPAQDPADFIGNWNADSNESFEMHISRIGHQVSIEFIEQTNDVIHSPLDITCEQKQCVVYEIFPDRSRPVFFSFQYASAEQIKIQKPPMVLSEAGRVKFVSSGTVFRKIK
jgi:hypothetical protein